MDGEAAAGLPAELTSFIGRRREYVELRRLLGEARLITLTGPAGIGKTRLATRVAARIGHAFAQRVVFVDLAGLRDPNRLPDQVAKRLNLQNMTGRPICDVVLDYLQDRQVLLVLDNCEHMMPDCSVFVGLLLAQCPKTRILATSRQSLAVAGERVLPVAPLPLPDAREHAEQHELEQYDGIRLFVERATAVCPSFQITHDNSAHVARLCRHLEGIPLALELAAARVRVLAPNQITDRLASRLELLTKGPRSAPERHQTLRAAIQWSYDLCSTAEQVMWARLSVFVDGFDLEAAEYVCAGPHVPDGAVIDLIDSLLDKSIIVRTQQTTSVRHRMLVTLREYGREQLENSGDLAKVTRRHRDWFARLASAADEQWVSQAQSKWTARLHNDLANLRAALEWSIHTPGEAGAVMRMMRHLSSFWATQGLNAEGLTWLGRALAVAPPDHLDRAWALATSAEFSFWMTNLSGTLMLLDQADELNAGRDKLLTGYTVGLRGLAHRNDPQASAVFTEKAVDIFREQGQVRGELHPLFGLAVARAYLDDLAGARVALERMTALTKTAGDVIFRNMARFATVAVEVTAGDAAVAARTAREALAASAATGYHSLDVAYFVEALAWVASRQGDHKRAAILFGAAAARWEHLGISPEQMSARAHQNFHDATRSNLGAEQFADAFDAGRRLLYDDTISFALEEHGSDTSHSGLTAHGPLSERQWEIARLIADGLINREIASRLFISPRTVEGHVQVILKKLGLSKRTQIAAWAIKCQK
ncbi:ATP-binding protein [Actinomadura opuntiae]|uniref:ATP-binding protein n=1 Tax=Actinomadura sp. OS1-43 TaxID=604315 RepID=UPI00255B0D12|nr:LuxR C-terminal-related transcriptional regulator [Actinomadura sp. OS1-43]MDL4821114.1 LuxR C-terminal-related transcriptional regulator [Actinomadura sp. OS1-43]